MLNMTAKVSQSLMYIFLSLLLLLSSAYVSYASDVSTSNISEVVNSVENVVTENSLPETIVVPEPPITDVVPEPPPVTETLPGTLPSEVLPVEPQIDYSGDFRLINDKLYSIGENLNNQLLLNQKVIDLMSISNEKLIEIDTCLQSFISFLNIATAFIQGIIILIVIFLLYKLLRIFF